MYSMLRCPMLELQLLHRSSRMAREALGRAQQRRTRRQREEREERLLAQGLCLLCRRDSKALRNWWRQVLRLA